MTVWERKVSDRVGFALPRSRCDLRSELWWHTKAKLMTEMDRTRLLTFTTVNW